MNEKALLMGDVAAEMLAVKKGKFSVGSLDNK